MEPNKSALPNVQPDGAGNKPLSDSTVMTALDLRELALAQRFSIWGSLAGFVGLLTSYRYVLFVATLFMIYCAWRILKAGQFSVTAKVIWLVLTLIPLVNLLALISLSHRAALKLRAAGIRVGLFGVKMHDLSTQSRPSSI